eukprot:4007564-Pyramimonas_sp.AAC.1
MKAELTAKAKAKKSELAARALAGEHVPKDEQKLWMLRAARIGGEELVGWPRGGTSTLNRQFFTLRAQES